MKRIMICLALSLCSTLVVAKEKRDDMQLSDFVVGQYRLIGQVPDSDVVLGGTVDIAPTKKGLRMTRHINGRTTTGSAAIETALAGEAKVLRWRFMEAGKAYESTCLIASDLDNNARLTCYRYAQQGETKRVGLEALFMEPHP